MKHPLLYPHSIFVPVFLFRIFVLLFLFRWDLFTLKPHLPHYLIDVTPSKSKHQMNKTCETSPFIPPFNFCSAIFCSAFLFCWDLFALRPYLPHYLIDVTPSKSKHQMNKTCETSPFIPPFNFCSAIFCSAFLFRWELFALRPHLPHYLIDVTPSKSKHQMNKTCETSPFIPPFNFCSIFYSTFLFCWDLFALRPHLPHYLIDVTPSKSKHQMNKTCETSPFIPPIQFLFRYFLFRWDLFALIPHLPHYLIDVTPSKSKHQMNKSCETSPFIPPIQFLFRYFLFRIFVPLFCSTGTFLHLYPIYHIT